MARLMIALGITMRDVEDGASRADTRPAAAASRTDVRSVSSHSSRALDRATADDACASE